MTPLADWELTLRRELLAQPLPADFDQQVLRRVALLAARTEALQLAEETARRLEGENHWYAERSRALRVQQWRRWCSLGISGLLAFLAAPLWLSQLVPLLKSLSALASTPALPGISLAVLTTLLALIAWVASRPRGLLA
jgi:hypothetical protein